MAGQQVVHPAWAERQQETLPQDLLAVEACAAEHLAGLVLAGMQARVVEGQRQQEPMLGAAALVQAVVHLPQQDNKSHPVAVGAWVYLGKAQMVWHLQLTAKVAAAALEVRTVFLVRALHRDRVAHLAVEVVAHQCLAHLTGATALAVLFVLSGALAALAEPHHSLPQT